MDDLLPLAYMATVVENDLHGPVYFICAGCATERADGDIAAYNEARGFDWRGAWIDPPENDDEFDEYQERNGLVVGDPVYVLFGDGLTINQAIAVNPEAIASAFGIDVGELQIEETADPDPTKFECAECGAECITIDASTLMDSPDR